MTKDKKPVWYFKKNHWKGNKEVPRKLISWLYFHLVFSDVQRDCPFSLYLTESLGYEKQGSVNWVPTLKKPGKYIILLSWTLRIFIYYYLALMFQHKSLCFNINPHCQTMSFTNTAWTDFFIKSQNPSKMRTVKCKLRFSPLHEEVILLEIQDSKDM